jgi:hypothetical protein
VAENQPTNKNRMTTELSNFAARLLPLMRDTARQARDNEFNELALELFALQFKSNAAYRKICVARNLAPGVVEHWTQIPAVPTAAFKELDLTCLAPAERTAVFHSSGTTEQRPSRHFHNAESLALYEASLWSGFERYVLRSADSLSASSCCLGTRGQAVRAPLIILTPPPAQAPHSSLVHMFETVRQQLGGASVPASRAGFVGKLADDGAWTLDFARAIATLGNNPQSAIRNPQLILGTAFSFVHLLDYLEEENLRFNLPAGSRVMETGGYKNRSRSLSKTELHQLITERLGILSSHIICEYGMSELSSQAYDGIEVGVGGGGGGGGGGATRPSMRRIGARVRRAAQEPARAAAAAGSASRDSIWLA